MKMLLLSAALIVPTIAVSQPAHAQVAGQKIPGSYICVFKKDAVSRDAVSRESRRIAQAHGGQIDRVYDVALRGFNIRMPDIGLQLLKQRNPNIAYCEQDQVVTIGQRTSRNNISIQAAEETPWGVARVNGGLNGSTATAWVIDTGIDFTHPDLNVDTARSRSFVRDSSARDQNGHGTHVAGTIAAKAGNGIGVVGVAPGTKVVAVRVLDRRGSGSNSGVIAGVNYVAANGKPGDVANMSLGGGVSQALDDAVVKASSVVKFALAAGNESDNANNHSPARANGPNIYTVSAFAFGDKWASFSNFGTPPVDYAEPGVSIKSTWLNGGYNTISGTSMATPHLAGLLLLGAVRSNGTVAGDPDSFKEPIGVK